MGNAGFPSNAPAGKTRSAGSTETCPDLNPKSRGSYHGVDHHTRATTGFIGNNVQQKPHHVNIPEGSTLYRRETIQCSTSAAPILRAARDFKTTHGMEDSKHGSSLSLKVGNCKHSLEYERPFPPVGYSRHGAAQESSVKTSAFAMTKTRAVDERSFGHPQPLSTHHNTDCRNQVNDPIIRNSSHGAGARTDQEILLGNGAIVTWDCWSVQREGKKSPLREVIIRPGNIHEVTQVQAVQCNSLLSHVPGAFDKFAIVSFGKKDALDHQVEAALHAGFEAYGNSWNFFCGKETHRAYFAKGSQDEVEQLRQSYFPQLMQKSFAKQLKYMGLLTSQLEHVARLPQETLVEHINDVERNEFCFTDGNGYISTALVDFLCNQLNLKDRPSVWQVRYCGYGYLHKGILLENGRLQGFLLKFRRSMTKSKIGSELESLSGLLGIVKWSKPHTLASLNSQAIALLSAGVPEHVLEEIHAAYVKNVVCSSDCPASAAITTALAQELPLWEKLRKASGISIPKAYCELLDLQTSLLQGGGIGVKNRLRIPLLASRLLFGACDPELNLPEGTCFARVRVGKQYMVVKGLVFVYRSPSYSPGDVRILKAIDIPGCELSECIMFSSEGDRPVADMMSGGDLDGDLFAVVWDHRLVEFAPSFKHDALDYKPGKPLPSKAKNCIEHLLMDDQSVLSRIDSVFWCYAAVDKVTSDACKQLALIFSRAVDKVPEEMAILDDMERKKPLNKANPLWLRLEKIQAMQRELCVHADRDASWAKFKRASCWNKIPSKILSSMIPLSQMCSSSRHPQVLHEVRSFDGRLKCPCYSQGTHSEERQMCRFDCVDATCKKNHPNPEAAAAEWRTLAEQELLGESSAASEYRCARNAVEAINERLSKFHKAVKSAEAKKRQPGGMTALEVALENLKKAKSGEAWNIFDDKVREIQQTIGIKKESITQLAQSTKRLADDYSKCCWKWSLNAFLRGPFEKWSSFAKLQVFRRKLNESRRDIQSDCAHLEEEQKRLEELRDEHFSKEAYDKAKASLADAEEKNGSLNLALDRFSSRVANLLLENGSAIDWMHCNCELYYTLEREKRRIRNLLPVYKDRKTIWEKLVQDGAVVVTAGTGSGKSTQIPGYLVDDLDAFGPVVCTQPRRLAARKLAERVAEEFSTELGDLVGYHVGARGQNAGESQKKSSNSKLIFVTDGLLLHHKQFAVEMGAMVVDEAHERGRDSDLLLARWRKNKLKDEQFVPLVVMSASINAQSFADYLQCEVVDIPGKLYDVQEHYAPIEDENGRAENELDEDEKTGMEKMCQHACDVLFDSIVNQGKEGDVLIFLPGKAEVHHCVELIKKRSISKEKTGRYLNNQTIINQTGENLKALQKQLRDITQKEKDLSQRPLTKRQKRKRNGELGKRKADLQRWIAEAKRAQKHEQDIERNMHKKRVAKHWRTMWYSTADEVVDAYPLYSSLSAKEQYEATNSEWRQKKGNAYVRKIVCCTNIAETSLTIDGVCFVIDSGLARQIKYDHLLRCSSLCLVKTSQAAAKQRKGRAGRISPGWCYRLFSKEDFNQRPQFEDPEMLKTPVEALLLYLYSNDFGEIDDLGLLDSPPAHAINAAKQALIDLEFLMSDGHCLTEDGSIAAELALRPWSSRMLLESRSLNCSGKAITLAALLEELDVQWRLEHAEFFSPQGDILSLLRLWDAYCKCNEKHRRSWCEQRQLRLEEFHAVNRRIKRIQQVLRQRGRLACEDGDEESLVRAFVRGYFQFFAVHHDRRFPRAGYSVLTPLLHIPSETPNIETNATDSPPTTPKKASGLGLEAQTEALKKDLLKVELDQRSTLHLQSAEQPMQWVIFASLRSVSSKPPCTTMNIVCAIDPDMVLDEAPQSWQTRVLLREHLDGNDLRILKSKEIHSVGPGIIKGCLLRDRRKRIKEVEHKTNAKVLPVVELSCIFVWGSEQETAAAYDMLRESVVEARASILAQYVRFHPVRVGLECTVALRMKANAGSVEEEEEEEMNEFSHLQPGTRSRLSREAGTGELEMAIVRHVGDVRGLTALHRQALIHDTPEDLEEELQQFTCKSEFMSHAKMHELTFANEEDCQNFLTEHGNRWKVARKLRTVLSLANAQQMQEQYGSDWEKQFEQLRFIWKEHAVHIAVQWDPRASILIDQRLQFFTHLQTKKLLDVTRIELPRHWKELYALRKDVSNACEAHVLLEPGQFLICGTLAQRKEAKAQIDNGLQELSAMESETVFLGEGLAALQGPAGSVFAKIEKDHPNATFDIDMQRRLIHIKAPRSELGVAVDSVNEALVRIDGRELPACICCRARIGTKAQPEIQLLLCGCRYCKACLSDVCFNPCKCGSPIIPADIIENLGGRAKHIFKQLYVRLLEEVAAPGEKVHICSSCKSPILIEDAEEEDAIVCQWCTQGTGRHRKSRLDLRFKSEAICWRDWTALESMCRVENLGLDWWRFKGSASALTKAQEKCESWLKWVEDDFIIQPNTEDFVRKVLKDESFGKRGIVKGYVKAKRVHLEGYASHVQSSIQWLHEKLADVKSESVAIKQGQESCVIGKQGAKVKAMQDKFDVLIWVGKGEVFVSGFGGNVMAAKTHIKGLIAVTTEHIKLPSPHGCNELAWKYLRPDLNKLKNVVHNSSGPQKVILEGPRKLVEEASSLLHTRLQELKSEQVYVSRDKKGLLIGKKGKTLQKLQEGGATICIGNEEDDSVYIGGTSSIVMQAVAEILRIVQQPSRVGYELEDSQKPSKGHIKDGRKGGKGKGKGKKPPASASIFGKGAATKGKQRS